MSNLKNLVPPLELCKLIPQGEFADSAFVWVVNGDYQPKFQIVDKRKYPFIPEAGATLYPAPTLDEILDELHKCQGDVFLKWSETAYNAWLVNAYTNSRNEDYQAHYKSKVIAALKVWLKMKGIKNEQ